MTGSTRPRSPAVFVSADWSKEVGKRSVWIADVRTRRIVPAASGNRPWTLTHLMELARSYSRAGSVLVGVDAALGVSGGFWRLVHGPRRPYPFRSFIEWLRHLDPDGPFFGTTTDPGQWSVDQPWFQVRPGPGGRAEFTKHVDDGFLRSIESATYANPLFAVGGIPGTVGSGTRSLWRALIRLSMAGGDFAIWAVRGRSVSAPCQAPCRARGNLSPVGVRDGPGRGTAGCPAPLGKDPTCGAGIGVRGPAAHGLGRVVRRSTGRRRAYDWQRGRLRRVHHGGSITAMCAQGCFAEQPGLDRLGSGGIDAARGCRELRKPSTQAPPRLTRAAHGPSPSTFFDGLADAQGLPLPDPRVPTCVQRITRRVGCARRIVAQASGLAPGSRRPGSPQATVQA